MKMMTSHMSNIPSEINTIDDGGGGGGGDSGGGGGGACNGPSVKKASSMLSKKISSSSSSASATTTSGAGGNGARFDDQNCGILNQSNSMDHCDMTSLEILNKCHLDLFPKKKTTCDDVNCMSVVDQLPILNGEYIEFIGPSGKLNDDILLITNFRLFTMAANGSFFLNMPLMLIESFEIRENLYIYIYLKNAKTIRLVFRISHFTFYSYLIVCALRVRQNRVQLEREGVRVESAHQLDHLSDAEARGAVRLHLLLVDDLREARGVLERSVVVRHSSNTRNSNHKHNSLKSCDCDCNCNCQVDAIADQGSSSASSGRHSEQVRVCQTRSARPHLQGVQAHALRHQAVARLGRQPQVRGVRHLSGGGGGAAQRDGRAAAQGGVLSQLEALSGRRVAQQGQRRRHRSLQSAQRGPLRLAPQRGRAAHQGHRRLVLGLASKDDGKGSGGGGGGGSTSRCSCH